MLCARPSPPGRRLLFHRFQAGPPPFRPVLLALLGAGAWAWQGQGHGSGENTPGGAVWGGQHCSHPILQPPLPQIPRATCKCPQRNRSFSGLDLPFHQKHGEKWLGHSSPCRFRSNRGFPVGLSHRERPRKTICTGNPLSPSVSPKLPLRFTPDSQVKALQAHRRRPGPGAVRKSQGWAAGPWTRERPVVETDRPLNRGRANTAKDGSCGDWLAGTQEGKEYSRQMVTATRYCHHDTGSK